MKGGELERPKEEVVDLIKKLLNLSASPNEHEAALALEKAQSLLLKYNLQMRDLELKQEYCTLDLINLPVDFNSKLPAWKILLINTVALSNFCKVVTSGTKVHLLGRGFNIVAVMEMSVWVINQLEAVAISSTAVYPGRDKIRYRNSFLLGAVGRIGYRLKEAQQKEMVSSQACTALVVDSKKALEDFTKTQFPNLHHSNIGNSHSSQGYSDGQRAGNQVSLTAPSRHIQTQAQIGG